MKIHESMYIILQHSWAMYTLYMHFASV